MPRDTTDDWQRIGETEPWFGVLSAAKFLRANLTEQAIEDFYQHGVSDIVNNVDVMTRHFGNFKPSVGLDFECGVGRLAFAMAHYCDRVIDLDISPSMLEEGEKQRVARNIANVEFSSDLQNVSHVDWINSYIVFQHILPRAGYLLLEDLLKRLNLGGFISIQLTYFHDQRDMTSLNRDPAAYTYDGELMRVLADAPVQPGEMSMYDYDLNRVFRLLYCYGLDDTLVKQTDHGGCHGLWLYGVKQR